MSLLLVVFWTAVGAVCVTLALTVGVRVSSGIARRRIARYERVLHAHLTAYVAGVRDDPPPAPQGRFEKQVLRRDLVALVPNVKGDAAARVAGLFTAAGLVEVARRDLGARGSLTRIRAAEALGAMQVTEAEPWLVAGLGHHDPLLRLACARALADLRATEALPRIMMALREVGADPVMFRRFWLPSARLGSRSCGGFSLTACARASTRSRGVGVYRIAPGAIRVTQRVGESRRRTRGRCGAGARASWRQQGSSAADRAAGWRAALVRARRGRHRARRAGRPRRRAHWWARSRAMSGTYATQRRARSLPWTRRVLRLSPRPWTRFLMPDWPISRGSSTLPGDRSP